MLDPSSTKRHEHPFLLNHGLGSRSDNYESLEAINNGSRGRKTSQDHSNYGSRNGIDWRYREENKDEDESGVCSPPLWRKSSPPRSPQRQRNHYRSLSPASRTQAIARGQHELMEMVKNMPETCYELSLKDLVEHPMVLARQQQSMSEERNLMSCENLFRAEDNNNNNNNNNNKKRISIDRKAPGKNSRSSVDNGGFLLKMVFPVTFRSKTKKTMKKNDSMANSSTTSARVSPKPLVSDGSAKGVDKEWWKKRFSVSGDSESGDSSINSGSMKSSESRSSSSSSRSSSRRHGNGGCWSFILIKKNKRRNQ